MIGPFFLLKKLRRNLSLEKTQLEQIQLEKFKALITHAYENVTYYKNLFVSSGLKPSDIKEIRDIVKIPTISKLKLQSLNKDEIMAKGINPGNTMADVTSGSTGIPLHVHFTKEDYVIRSLMFIRTFLETGYRLTDRQAIVFDTRFVTNKKRWFQKLGIMRKGYIPVQLDIERQIEILRSLRPDYIHGYPLSIALIADEMLKRGIDDISPRMVCTGAEIVSKKTRKTINSAFKVNMVDTYATIESGLIAWECTTGRGYHINIDSVVLEFLNNNRPAAAGERGRAVVTNLHSFAMPIIRYELGDICISSGEACPCGIELPLMSIVEGRVDDMIRTPGGEMVSPNSITNAMEAAEGIKQFRVLQENEYMILVQIVKGKNYSSDTPETVRRLIRELVGNEIDVKIQLVDNIPKEQSGKIRAVISRLTGNGYA